jgi:hypothetical protein
VVGRTVDGEMMGKGRLRMRDLEVMDRAEERADEVDQ